MYSAFSDRSPSAAAAANAAVTSGLFTFQRKLNSSTSLCLPSGVMYFDPGFCGVRYLLIGIYREHCNRFFRACQSSIVWCRRLGWTILKAEFQVFLVPLEHLAEMEPVDREGDGEREEARAAQQGPEEQL